MHEIINRNQDGEQHAMGKRSKPVIQPMRTLQCTRAESARWQSHKLRVQTLTLWCSAQEPPGVLSLYGSQGLFVDSVNFRPVHSLKRQIVPLGRQNVGEILEHRFVNADSSTEDGKEDYSGGKAQSSIPRNQHDIRGIIHHSYLYVVLLAYIRSKPSSPHPIASEGH